MFARGRQVTAGCWSMMGVGERRFRRRGDLPIVAREGAKAEGSRQMVESESATAQLPVSSSMSGRMGIGSGEPGVECRWRRGSDDAVPI